PAFGSRECDVAQKWAKALSLPSIEGFQIDGPVLPPFMPDYSLLDWYYWWRGTTFSAAQLRRRSGPMIQSDLWSLGSEFSIPVFFFEGSVELRAPIDAGRAYFGAIKGPQNQLVLFMGAGRFVAFERPDEFLAGLVEHLRPLSLQ